jgi:hypothetical protein
MTTAQPRIDQAAIVSLATAVVGVIALPILGGSAALLATLSLVWGFLALSRINRTEGGGSLLRESGSALFSTHSSSWSL